MAPSDWIRSKVPIDQSRTSHIQKVPHSRIIFKRRAGNSITKGSGTWGKKNLMPPWNVNNPQGPMPRIPPWGHPRYGLRSMEMAQKAYQRTIKGTFRCKNAKMKF